MGSVSFSKVWHAVQVSRVASPPYPDSPVPGHELAGFDDTPGAPRRLGENGKPKVGGKMKIALNAEAGTAPECDISSKLLAPGWASPKPKSATPNNESPSSGSSSVNSQVAAPQGLNSLVTGTWPAPQRVPLASGFLRRFAVTSFMWVPLMDGWG